ncbi:MAG TPA: outer membrane beta-barrel protein [Rhodopseudomonas sp.]|uniref:outer membrane protein n=1 Tax=Rhodopseudomonas sp. TaxID=1078 RepID=UPI002ED85E58
MNKLAISTLLLAASSGAALAADLPARYTKAPPPVAAVYDWTGFYIGANGGWGQSHDNRSNDTTATFLGSYDGDGAVAGGQIGYRAQYSSWVFGLEIQGNWADLHGSTAIATGAATTIHSKLDAFGLFTGQLGYAWNNALLYVKGGAAVTDRNYDFISNTTGLVTASTGYNTRLGATVGVGLEYGFYSNWSLGVEYDHIFENKHNVSFVSAATGLNLTSVYGSGGDTDLVVARLNYRLGNFPIPRY